MNKYKKILELTIILVLSLVFTGCGEIKLNTSTTINDNESGKATFYISYDDTVYSSLKHEIFNTKWAKDNGFVFNKYNKNTMTVEELSYKFNNLKELQYKINSTNVLNMSYKTKMGLNKKTYYIKLNFNKDIMDDVIKGNIALEDGRKNTEAYSYIENVILLNSIEVPGQLIDSNRSKAIGENTGVWRYKLSQIDKNTEIKISYSVTSYSILGYICIAVLICVGGVYYYIMKNRIH